MIYANLDKSTYLSQGGLTKTGTILGGEVVDGAKFWLPIETSTSPTKKAISYILPSVIVIGFVYIVFSDGKVR